MTDCSGTQWKTVDIDSTASPGGRKPPSIGRTTQDQNGQRREESATAKSSLKFRSTTKPTPFGFHIDSGFPDQSNLTEHAAKVKQFRKF